MSLEFSSAYDPDDTNLSPLCLRFPIIILLTNNNLIDAFNPTSNNLLPINQIILTHPPFRLFHSRRHPRPNMSAHQPPPRKLKINFYKPQLIHQRRGNAPRPLIQTEIIAFKDNDLCGGEDG